MSELALVVSVLSLSIAAAALFFSRFAPAKLNVGIGSWISVTIDIASGDSRHLAIWLNMTVANEGAQPAFVHDVALQLRLATTIRYEWAFVARYDVPYQVGPTFDPVRKLELPFFTGIVVPAHGTVTRSLLFGGTEKLPLKEVAPGIYEMQLSFRSQRDSSRWLVVSNDKFSITPEDLADLSSLKLTMTEHGTVRTDEWRTRWRRVESAERAVSSLTRGEAVDQDGHW